MMSKFHTLFLATVNSLKDRNVSVSEIQSRVATKFNASNSLAIAYDSSDSPIWHLIIPGLMNANNVDEIMICIGRCCSFVTFRILELIVDHNGTEDDKLNVIKYKKELNTYSQQHVLKHPLQISKLSNGRINLFVKLDDTYEKCKIERLIEFVHNFLDVIKCSFAIKLCCFEPQHGCALTFQLPFALLPYIFPLSSNNQAALANMGVDKLWLSHQISRGESLVFLLGS